MSTRKLERATSIKSCELIVFPPGLEESLQTLQKRNSKEGKLEPLPCPPDRGFHIGWTVIFLGITSTLVTSFIITANDYWMYKFRDPSSPTYDARNKTALQTNFVTSMGVVNVIPVVIGLIFTITYGPKIKSRIRITSCYAFTTLSFVFYTIFVQINTDSWQVLFFGVVIILSALNGLMVIVLLATIIAIVPKLPPNYLKFYIYGQGVSSMFSSILQIICLAITDDSLTVALIYFGTGTVMYAISLVLYVSSQWSPFFQHYINDTTEDIKRPIYGIREIFTAVITIWPVIAIMGMNLIGTSIPHPGMTNLIVSEHYHSHSVWSDKYFVPVITYFLTSAMDMVGKVFASKVITPKSYVLFVVLVALRMVLFPISIIFCNVQTNHRKIQPIFTRDWEYIFILVVSSVSSGYLSTCCFLSIPNFIKPDSPTEIYYLMLQVTLVIMAIIISPLAAILINVI